MKKLLSVFLTLCLIAGIVLAAMLISSADEIEETRFYFLNTQDPDFNNAEGPGYYVKHNNFVFDENNENGVSFHLEAGDSTGRCLWAFKEPTAKKYPYLHYTIPENNDALYQISISNCWDYWPEIELDLTPGDHIVNLIQEMDEHGYDFTLGWYYVVPYITSDNGGGTASINNFYLSNYGAEGDPVIDPATVTEPPQESTDVPGTDEPAAEIGVDGKIFFTADFAQGGAKYVNGVMYVDPGYKDTSFVTAELDNSVNGITVISEGADAHSIWADVKDVVTQYRYLHYTIPEEGAPGLIRIALGYAFGWDASKVVPFEVTPGEHIIDLTTVEGYEDEDRAYFYFEIAISADLDVRIDNLFLSVSGESTPVPDTSEPDTETPVVTTDNDTQAPTSTAPTTEPKDGAEKASSTNTGLIIGIAAAAVVVVAAVVGIVIGAKKKK